MPSIFDDEYHVPIHELHLTKKVANLIASGNRVIITNPDRSVWGAIIPPDDFEVLEEFHGVEEELERIAVSNAQSNRRETQDWETVKDEI